MARPEISRSAIPSDVARRRWSHRWLHRWSLVLAAFAPLAVAGSSARASEDSAPPAPHDQCAVVDPDTGEVVIHPECFFHSLLDRYRTLDTYGDRTTVTRVSVRDGEPDRRTESMVEVQLTDGLLDVSTAGRQARRGLGVDLSVAAIPVLERASMAYKLWIAPHMSLKFATDAGNEAPAPECEEADPDRAPREHPNHANHAAPRRVTAGGTELHATEAERVVIEERELVHLELRSGEPGSEDSAATYDLYVDPESMLIERIDGEERFPDGAMIRTTVEITPVHAEPTTSGADSSPSWRWLPAGAPAAPEPGPLSMRSCPVG